MDASIETLAVEVRGLVKSFGGAPVIDGVDLVVPRGSVYALLGRNGAGKSTTLRLLLGLLQADAGTIRVLGSEMPGQRMEILRRVGSMIESPSLYPALSARGNLSLDARIRGLGESDIRRALEIAELADTGQPVHEYSLGMKQRLSLALAVLGDPDLLLLDEPTNGLDPAGIADMRRLLRDLPERLETTVLLSTHLLGEVEQIATHLCVLEAGGIRYQGRLDGVPDAGCRWLRFECAEADALLHWFLRNEPRRKPELDGDGIRVVVDDRSDAARVIREVVEADFEIHHASIERRGLEQIYFDLIADTPASQVGESA